MLILTRRVGETLYITISHEELKKMVESGSGVVITSTVLGVKGNQVRLGTNAPSGVGIDREEVHERKQLEIAEDAKRKLRHREGHSGDSGKFEGVARPVSLG